MYGTLFGLGLLIGGIFLAVLLIGDRRQARQEAQRKAMEEQIAAAQQPREGSWPPPPTAPDMVSMLPPVPSAKPVRTQRTSRKMVRNFFLVRNYAVATVIVAYLVSLGIPKMNFGWVLLATAVAAAVLVAILSRRKKSR